MFNLPSTYSTLRRYLRRFRAAAIAIRLLFSSRSTNHPCANNLLVEHPYLMMFCQHLNAMLPTYTGT